MTTEVQTCYRHDDRRAGVRCQRCERPICPQCMHQASVGFHCPECFKRGAQKVVSGRNLAARATPVTTALVAVNVAIYVLSSLSRGLVEPASWVLTDFALVGEGLTRNGAGLELVGVATGEWYRLVTGGFLHGSLLHLAFNMYVLWILGKQLEKALGGLAFGAVYGASLLAGSLGVMLLEPNALTVGASGAVFGLFGYAVVGQLARGINPMQTGLGGVIVINLIFTFVVPGISIGGHLGGLVGGAAAGTLYDVCRRRLRLPDTASAAVVAGFGLVCAVAAVAVA